MSNWFSIDGIKKEVKRVRWPKKEDLFNNAGKIITFSVFFCVFFVVCEYIITLFLKLIGIGA